MTDYADAAVLGYLRKQGQPMYATDVSVALGLGYGPIYPILARLEAKGVVQSDWEHVQGEFPRRRIYWVAD